MKNKSVSRKIFALAVAITIFNFIFVSNLYAAPPVTQCLVYAVDDGPGRSSQFFTYDPITGEVNTLGPLYVAANFESLEIDSQSRQLYTVSSFPSSLPAGYLYTLNPIDGSLEVIGDTTFNGIEALASRPDGTLWAWSEGDGLLVIDKNTGDGNLVYQSSVGIEGLAWDNTGTYLYGVDHKKLYRYNPQSKSLTLVTDNLSGKEMEALDIRTDGLAMVGLHNANNLNIKAYDLNTLAEVSSENVSTPYYDIEGIAWPDGCPYGSPGGPPPPDDTYCVIKMSPEEANVSVGGTTVYNVTIDEESARIDDIVFTSMNTGVATLVGEPTPLSVEAKGESAGITDIKAEAYMGGVPVCSETSAIEVGGAFCSIELQPDMIDIAVGGEEIFTANYSASTVPGHIRYKTSDYTVASVNPNTPTSTGGPAVVKDFVTTPSGTSSVLVRGESLADSTYIRSLVYIDGSVKCRDISVVNVRTDPWWQVVGGDAGAAGGNVSSTVPISPNCTAPCSPVFIKDNPLGHPGIPSASGSTVFDPGDPSSQNWNAAGNSYLSSEPFSYDYFWSKLPSGLTPAVANNISDLQIGGAESPLASSYFWYQHSGPLTLGDASIPTLTLTDRRVILFVDGDLTLQAKVKVSKGTSAFYAIVSGDIIIDPGVGHTPIIGYTSDDADIEGLFYAEGLFSTGTTDTTPGDYSDDNDLQLHIRGGVAAGSFNLQRVLANNSATPAEVFEFAPDMVVGWPPYLTTKKVNWREVAP